LIHRTEFSVDVADRPLPPLHAIVDVDVAARAGWDPLDLARAFLDGGARCLQVRAKHLASALLLELSRAVVAAARTFDAAVIVNDRADVAWLAGAAGVHVGQDDLSPADARAVVGPHAVVGYSTHTLAQFERALREPASYLAIGPVFGTVTKQTGYDAVGLALVEAAARMAPERPIVAIGGVTLENAASAWAAGAHSVAVIGDLLAAGDPRARVASYNRLADASLRGPSGRV
jgi:thiamine-phosphate pyrophosphorylase